MTFDQYIDNPSGVKSAIFSNRQMYKDLYTNKFNNLILREAGKINYTLMYNDKKDEYYCHVMIPSESVEGFYYDVVIKFSPDTPSQSALPNLNEYNVQMFSNDPSFAYTYLKAFIKNKIFLTELSEKMDKEALAMDQKIKNPTNTVGYVKTIYFAYLWMKQKGLFVKFNYKSNGIKYDKKMLLSNVEHISNKVHNRQTLSNRKEKEKYVEKVKKERERQSTILSKNKNIRVVGSTKNSRSTSRSNRATKSVKHVKHI